jgi:hypothetical protein
VFFQELIVDADRRRHHFAMTIAQHIYHFTNHVVDTPEVIPSEVEEAVRTLVRWAGDDPDREGLIETPKGVARAWREYCKGYEEDAATRCSAFNFSILLCFTSRTHVQYKDKQWLVRELPVNRRHTEVSVLSRWQRRCRRQAR